MIYFLFGPDTYRSREKLKELMDKYQDGFEIHKIDGEKINVNEFMSKLNAVSLLAQKRLMVIENLSQNSGQKEVVDFLKDWLKKQDSSPTLRRGANIGDDILIFYEDKVDKKTSLYKFLGRRHSGMSPSIQVFEFEELNGAELKNWARGYIKKKRGKIEPMALEELVMGNNNLWALSRELDKLLAYNKNITLANVQLLTTVNFDDNIFNLTDAIGTGNKAQALDLLNQQLESGAQPIYLLSMIIRQFRILMQVKEAVGNNSFVNYSFVAKELGLHPFVVQKSIGQSKKYSFDELEKIYAYLQELDLKLKSSKLSPESLFTKLVVTSN